MTEYYRQYSKIWPLFRRLYGWGRRLYTRSCMSDFHVWSTWRQCSQVSFGWGPLESYTESMGLLFAKTTQCATSSRWYTSESFCAYLYSPSALSLAKFIIGDYFHMIYWRGDDLNQQEDGDEYVRKCNDICKKVKALMNIDSFVPMLVMAVVTASPRWYFPLFGNKEREKRTHQKDGVAKSSGSLLFGYREIIYCSRCRDF